MTSLQIVIYNLISCLNLDPMSNKNLKDFDKIWNANWVPARKDVHADHLKKVSFA